MTIEGASTLVVARAGASAPWQLQDPVRPVRGRSIDLLLDNLLAMKSKSILAITFEFHGYSDAFEIATRVRLETTEGAVHELSFTRVMGGTGVIYAIIGERVHEVDGLAAEVLHTAPDRLIER
jgi:hypothetical protein